MDHLNTTSRLYIPNSDFCCKVTVQSRFSDYDMFGHLNNNSFMAYFDVGKSALFNDIIGKTCTPDRLGAVIVNINVDFLAPAMATEPLEVLTLVDNIGEHSFRLYQRIVNPLTGSVKAQAMSTLAGFDVATAASSPLHPDLVSALKRYL